MATNGYLVGIDVGGTNIKMMLADRHRRVLATAAIRTNRDLGHQRITDGVIKAVEDMIARQAGEPERVAAVAMGLPGIVDTKKMESVHLAYIGWNGFNPCARVAEHFGAPCAIENDANLSALGEYTFGCNGAYADMILLTLGTGLGGGVIIGGKLFGGCNNLSGEFGHLTLTPDWGETCLCGRKGCMEAYCSGSAMAAHAAKLMAENPDTALHSLVRENGGEYDNRLASAGARSGDPACLEIFRRFNYYLAVGCANIMKLFNPERIFIGGGLSNAGDLIFGPVNRDAVPRLLHERQYCPIEPARLGHEAGMYGAVALAEIVAGKMEGG